MSVRLAINGFGRIGRQIAREICSHRNHNLSLVAVNSLCRIEQSAHLLKYDSMYGISPLSVKTVGQRLVVNDVAVEYIEQEEPALLPWRDLGVDMVIECAGLGDRSRDHLAAGASRVIVAGSAGHPDITICMGVNHHRFEPARHRFVCGASCTANLIAPVIAVIDEAFGLEQAMVTFLHSYTSNQNLLDSVGGDLRQARSATRSIIPVATSAITHLASIFPALAGRIDGLALRVPSPLVHMADLVIKARRTATRESVLDVLEHASRGAMENILAVSDEPLVSCDFRGRSHSSIVDAEFSTVCDGMIKLVVWHDNEYGYSRRIVDLAGFVAGSNIKEWRPDA